MKNGIQNNMGMTPPHWSRLWGASASLLVTPQLSWREQPGDEADHTRHRWFFRSGHHLTKLNNHTAKIVLLCLPRSSVQLSNQQKTKLEIRSKTSPILNGHISNKVRVSSFKHRQSLLLPMKMHPNDCSDLGFTSTQPSEICAYCP